MGIRIHKEIGYFLPLDKFSNLIASDYKDTLEELDYNPKCVTRFWEQLIYSVQHYSCPDKVKKISMQLLGKEYHQEMINNKIQPYNLASNVFFSDEEKGFLFRTKELYEKSRHDNLIDYYEADFNDKIDYLNRAIYPTEGYIYKGGLKETFPKLVEGQVYNDYTVHAAFQRIHTHNQESVSTIAKGIVDTGYFHPNIEPSIFFIAKAAGVLEPTVTEKQFNLNIKPAILTYWG